MARPDGVSFGAHLKTWRADRGLTQDRLAELLHVTRQTILHWEGGADPPNVTSWEDKLRRMQHQAGEPERPSRPEVLALWKSDKAPDPEPIDAQF